MKTSVVQKRQPPAVGYYIGLLHLELEKVNHILRINQNNTIFGGSNVVPYSTNYNVNDLYDVRTAGVSPMYPYSTIVDSINHYPDIMLFVAYISPCLMAMVFVDITPMTRIYNLAANVMVMVVMKRYTQKCFCVCPILGSFKLFELCATIVIRSQMTKFNVVCILWHQTYRQYECMTPDISSNPIFY